MKKREIVGLVLLFVIMIVLSIIIMKNELGEKNKKQTLKAMTVEDALNLPYEVRMQTSYVTKEKQIQSRYGEPNLARKAGEYAYEIRNIDDGSKLYVIFDSKSGKVHDIWRLKKLFKKVDFDNIKVNSSTFDDVNRIDEYCLYFGDKEGEGISEHRLINNEILIIHYIKNNGIATVKELEFITPDPSSFTTILKKIDLKQILPE